MRRPHTARARAAWARALAHREAWRFHLLPQLVIWTERPNVLLVLGDGPGDLFWLPVTVHEEKDINDGHHEHPATPTGPYADAALTMAAAEAFADTTFPGVRREWMFVAGLSRARQSDGVRYVGIVAMAPAGYSSTRPWAAFMTVGSPDLPVLAYHRHEMLGDFANWPEGVAAVDAWVPPAALPKPCSCVQPSETHP